MTNDTFMAILCRPLTHYEKKWLVKRFFFSFFVSFCIVPLKYWKMKLFRFLAIKSSKFDVKMLKKQHCALFNTQNVIRARGILLEWLFCGSFWYKTEISKKLAFHRVLFSFDVKIPSHFPHRDRGRMICHFFKSMYCLLHKFFINNKYPF